MRRIGGIGLVVCAVSCSGCGPDAEQKARDIEALRSTLNGLQLPSEYRGGEALFDVHCVQCHGPRASGSEVGPPLIDIVYRPSHHADAAFQLAVIRGVPAHHWRFGDMAPVPGVSPEMTEEITAYVRWLQRQVGIM